MVIPVYNRAGVVRRTLNSIAAQTLLPARLIMVDNNSTDNSVEVVKSWLSDHNEIDSILLSQPTPGAAAARNAGLEAVETDFTMFFDSDDEMLPSHIADLQRAIDTHGKINIFGRDTQMPGGRIGRFEPDDAAWHNIMHGTMATQRYIAHTELFRQVGGWDDNVRVWDDIELGSRLIATGAGMMRLDGPPTVIVNASADSISGSNYASRADEYELALSRMAKILPAEWIDIKRMILSADMAREGARHEARAVHDGVLAHTHRPMLMRAVYAYRRAGMRGIARLIRPIMR